MTLRTVVKTLLVLVLALPMVAAVLVWVGGLLRAMGDPGGAMVVRHVGTVCQVAWVVCLIGLLVTLAIFVLGDERPASGEGE
jgi:Na+-driven multidrug efflux pump